MYVRARVCIRARVGVNEWGRESEFKIHQKTKEVNELQHQHFYSTFGYNLNQDEKSKRKNMLAFLMTNNGT